MDLDKIKQQLVDELDKQQKKEELYEQQASDIAMGLANGKKVDDGYYMWASTINDRHCLIVSARKMLMFQKGYRPMSARFELNDDYPLFDQIKETVKIMLKKQNGDYSPEMFEVEEENN